MLKQIPIPITTVLAMLLAASTLLGQQELVIRSKHLDNKDGLLGQRATAAFQDSDGFMWIATMSALNRYDGFNFTHFNQSNSKLNYREVQTRNLLEDAEGYLWLVYYDGVEFIHHQTFEVLTFKERFAESEFEPDEFHKIESNGQGDILIELKNKRKYLYQGRTKRIKHLDFLDNKQIHLFNDQGIWTTFPDSYKFLDFEGKTQIRTPKKAKYQYFFNHSSDRTYHSSFFDSNLHQYRVYEHRPGQEQQIATIPLDQQSGRLHPFLDKEKNLIISYNEMDLQRGIYFFDLDKQKLYQAPLEGDKTFLCYDKNGIAWISNQGGITLVETLKSPFSYYQGVRNARGIWANEEKVIVASSHSEEYVYEVGKRLPVGKFPNSLHTIAKDKNAFWGGNNGMFSHYDVNKMETIEGILIKKAFNGNLWASLRDREGNWWLSHESLELEKSILFYNSATGDSADIFDQYRDRMDLKDAHVIHFLEDGQIVWASSNKGLIGIHKKKGVVANYHKNATKEFQLPFQDVYWLYKDPEDVYWAATNYDGLVKFTLDDDLTVRSFKKYSMEDGLSSDVTYCILEDTYGRLWISTLQGISAMNKKEETFRIFTDANEELPFHEFNRTSGFQALDGRIYFGGVEGAVGFEPRDIDTARYHKPLLLASVLFFNGREGNKTDQTRTVLSEQRITIHPEVKYAKIKVALADYFDAQETRYYYKIDGLFSDFRPLEGNEVLLNGLPYGKYNILLRGQSRDNRFSTSEITLPLEIVRPFYLRWWFFLLGITFVLGIFWLLYHWRVAQLKRNQTRLENIVAKRTEQISRDKATMERQAEELKELDRMKDRFFANISHELRTPLTLILGPLGKILQDPTHLSNKQFTYLKVIKLHTDYLMKRINEIMELNRLEAKKGEVDLQPVRLYDFFKLTLGSFETIADQKNIVFSLEYQLNKSTQILTDKDKLEHIIYNYLSNAFKYTSKGGSVKVSVKEIKNRLRIEVKDSGIGIPAKDIPQIFSRFYQAENAQKAGSSGIGLALCREIATLLGGRVWVESEMGKGSTFFAEIPFEEFIGIIEKGTQTRSHELLGTDHPAFGEVSSKLDKNIDPQDKHSILVVEDNPDLRDYIQAMLSEYYTVQSVENGKEALEWLERNPEISLIVSDIMMPVMDGLEFLDAIKKSDAYRHIPMIMLTARHGMEVKLSALQLGVDDYITKPFDELELLIRIRNLLMNQKERIGFLKEETIEKDRISRSGDQSGPTSTALPAISNRMTREDQKWLSELEALVTTHLAESDFSVVTCAEKLFLSGRQLQRRIKQCTGLNFTKYLRLARLKRARQLLEKGEAATMAEVAYQVGFETPSYFSRLFREEYGRNPMDYMN